MTTKIIPTSAELVKQTLDARRHQQVPSLFEENQQMPYFWKLSELALTYPELFDITKPVSAPKANELMTTIKDKIPEFYALEQEPIHILNIKETYNIYQPDTQQIKTVRNGTNQYLTNIACEHLLRQQSGGKLQQAYFLYPDATPEAMIVAAQDLHFEYIRDQIAHTSNLLSAIINRARGARKTSFSEIWAHTWNVLYNVKSMDDLRDRYNIKASPIDYMKPQTLIFINSMLQEIAFKFSNQTYYTIDEVRDFAATKASIARAHFFRYGSTPEAQLTDHNTYRTIEKIRRAREKLWKSNYEISLQQR